MARYILTGIIWLMSIQCVAGTTGGPPGISPSVPEKILADAVPFAFSPSDFTVGDFRIDWSSLAIPGVETHLIPGSLQWVRVDDLLVLPRAQVAINIENVESGIVDSVYAHPLQVKNGAGSATVLVALLSGPANPITVTVKRAGKILTGQLQVHFSPEKASNDHIIFDVSCSRRKVSVTNQSLRPDQWIYIGCRPIDVEKNGHPSSALELVLFWDNAGKNLVSNGIEIPYETPGTWTLRVPSGSNSLDLASDVECGHISLEADTPDLVHRGNFSVGEGPYYFAFQSSADSFYGIVPLTTLYGSYSLGETTRLVFFSAITASPQTYTDWGTYLEFESSRGIDTRLHLNLFLGGHGLGYRTGNNYLGGLDIPQGIEFVYTDAFKRRFNLSGGGFVQPNIDGHSYYNLWLRWGSPEFFIETNYIYWTEQSPLSVTASEVGLTVGLPLFQVL